MKMQRMALVGLSVLLTGGSAVLAQNPGAAEGRRRPAQRRDAPELTEEEREMRAAMRQELREAREAGASEDEIRELRMQWRTRLVEQRQEGLTEEQRTQRLQRRREWEESLTDEQREQAREFMERRRRARETAPDRASPPRRRPQRPEPGAEASTPVEQEALREAMREALQFRRQWVLERYDKDGDGLLSDEERGALRQDLREHMLRFFE